MIPNVFATDKRSPGIQKCAKSAVKKGYTLIKIVERDAVVSFGAGVQADNLEYENRCEEQQSRKFATA